MLKLNKIYKVNCLNGLKKLPDESIQCCVTSPPYWRLRDYGVKGQLGLEATPELYVAALTEVFEEVKRVLKPDGTLWLNLGDVYWGSGKAGGKKNPKIPIEFGKARRDPSCLGSPTTGTHTELKKKDLVGIPWMMAFSLRKQGWWLRQDIIWHKPATMPESITDRCTKSHEYIFLLSKNAKYYFDHKAIQTVSKGLTLHDRSARISRKRFPTKTINGIRKGAGPYEMANRRSVWSITVKPFKGNHFATFPPELPELCIKAGSRKGDIILDPFMGAGTTAIAAQNLGRNYIGFELNAEYVKMAKMRLKTGK
jgi:DNA modification methylase